MEDNLIRTDVTVIGGGLAGMASSIHLARAGCRVVCVELAMGRSGEVGESLDWSAPDLLRGLGLPVERLLAEEIATWKRHVVLQLGDGTTCEYVPGEWLGRPPWRVELRTLHVDRTRLRAALKEILLSAGVMVLEDRVSEVEREGRRVTGLRTEGGKRITAPWFVDASGAATHLFARLFRLRAHEYGPRKVAMWSYFDVADAIEGTTLYTEGNQPPYMDWVWEIPIHPNTISVGYVATGDAIKELRQGGKTVDAIYREQVSRIPRFRALFAGREDVSAFVTSFRCGVYRNIGGPNWLVVGEAASMVDPMTSNGVTAALRTAEEASRLIIRSFGRGRLPKLAAALYGRRVLDMARFFNSGIEKVVYEWPVRCSIGVARAGRVYTVPAWLMNLLYSRSQPHGVLSTLLFSLVLKSLRAAAVIFSWLCRLRRTAAGRPGLVST